MLQTIESINNVVNNFIWGVPAMICIIGVGLYLSLRTGFIQIRKFPYALKTTLGRISLRSHLPFISANEIKRVIMSAVRCTTSKTD